MFERFTEGARRAIFFARYEASRYGSRFIETEHLLLGILRGGRSLAKWFPGETNVEAAIRSEIEKQIPPRERISTSVEVPISAECKTVLMLAADASEQLGHQQVDLEHLLVGILRVEMSLARQILMARGLKPEPILEGLAKAPSPNNQTEDTGSALMTLESFLSGLKTLSSDVLISFFSRNAQFIDVSGKRWNQGEMSKGFETLFAPYGKKNATYVVEATHSDTRPLFIATVRWNNALLASEQRAWMHLMTFVLVPEANIWKILSVQTTAVDFSAFRQTERT